MNHQKTFPFRPILRLAVAVALYAGTLFISSPVNAQSLPESFDFGLGITYSVTTSKKGDVKKGEDLGVWFSNGDYTGIETANRKGFFMVMDIKSQKMITLLMDQKMAMVMDIAKMTKKVKDQAPNQKPSDIKVTKTGKATVLGYTCDIYQVDSDQTRSQIWITTQLGGGMMEFAKGLAAILQSGPLSIHYPELKGIDGGVMLKMETTDKKSGNLTLMEAIAVDKDGKKIGTSDYKAMELPGN